MLNKEGDWIAGEITLETPGRVSNINVTIFGETTWKLILPL
jgi:hypothetical protein